MAKTTTVICRDAHQSSLLGTLALAMEAKKAGEEARVVFTSDALYALAGEVPWSWPEFFRPRATVSMISRNATKLGYPIGTERDTRWTDPARLMAAAQAAGVRLVACPIWTDILGVTDLPDGVERPDRASYLKALGESNQVIGAL